MAELDTSQGKGKKGKKKRGGKKASTRVDLTPMVDLGFLLITFFMLTTTFIKPQTMEINLPVKDKTDVAPADQPAVAASKTLSVIIGKDNEVYWFRGLPKEPLDGPSKTDFSKEGIRKVLLEWNAKLKVGGKEEMVVLIKATDDAIYKNAVDILDEMNICNIKRYALVDLSPEDKEAIKGL